MTGTCPICGAFDFEIMGDYRGAHPVFLGMKRAHCKTCEMVFADPMPSDSAQAEFNASYFNNAHGGKPQAAATLAFFFGIARLRAAHLEHYLRQNELSVSKVHEVGPGPGWFARSWMAQHPRTTYSAVETDVSCHTALREIGVQMGPIGNTADAEPVDLVVMTHVLEHVTEPAAFLLESTRRLRAGGILFIEVPCRDWEHKPLDEPHLLFFDKEPMKRLLENQGFREIKVSYHGQKIAHLQKASKVDSTIMALRSKLIGMGVIAPFGQMRRGMEPLTSSLERAVLAPYLAHQESMEPAWWLRALAVKS
jgi:trans-aconitate methyltransferase